LKYVEAMGLVRACCNKWDQFDCSGGCAAGDVDEISD
jgi:hypothetical protein